MSYFSIIIVFQLSKYLSGFGSLLGFKSSINLLSTTKGVIFLNKYQNLYLFVNLIGVSLII